MARLEFGYLVGDRGWLDWNSAIPWRTGDGSIGIRLGQGVDRDFLLIFQKILFFFDFFQKSQNFCFFKKILIFFRNLQIFKNGCVFSQTEPCNVFSGSDFDFQLICGQVPI